MSDFATRRRMMVDTQVRPSDVTEFPIIESMLSVPRELFVPRERIEAAYADDMIVLGQGGVLLDARSFAKMLEVLNLTNADMVLHVGAGLGYGAAVIARIAELVVALEENEELSTEAQSILSEINADNVIVQNGPLVEGVAKHAPYDAILIEGGVEELPEALTSQLKEGGRIVCIFMDGALGTVRLGVKLDGVVTWRFAFNAAAPVLQGFKKQASFAL